VDVIRSLRERSQRVRTWPIWELPSWLIVFVVVVALADAGVLAGAASRVTVHASDLETFGGLLVCSAATVEISRRLGENLGAVKDVHATWELPVAILLPLAFAPVLPIIRFTLVQWRTFRVPLYRRVFSAAAIGLSYVAAALVFHALVRLVHDPAASPASHAISWITIVAVSAVVQWTTNQILIWTAIKGSDPSVSVRAEQFAREPIFNDVTELCVAVLVTLCVAISSVSLLFALPFISLLQRSMRHARLLRDARADSKTGLLNAGTWEYEATAEVARAVRTKSPLAIAMLDIDRFKAVNDTYGHLLGDQVIKEIAHALKTLLRDYDVAGRFGGEEFAVLLPQTRAVDAFRIAERVRASIAGLCIIAPGAAGGERVHVTVSIGVAALDSGSERELPDLLAAADAALYRAKAGGRDQVQMISTTRGLSAVGSIPRGSDGAAAPEAPSMFRRPSSRATSLLSARCGQRRLGRRRGGDGQHREDLGASGVALRGVAGAQHLRGVVPLAGPPAHCDRRAAAVARHLPVPDLGRVLVLDLHRCAAVHRALGHLDEDRHVRRGLGGAAGRPRPAACRGGRAARQQPGAAGQHAETRGNQTRQPQGPGR
jgi:diguanylate cyclase (GGDEF)-like protein